MTADTHALRFLLLTFSGWVNRHERDLIEYLVEENRILKDHPSLAISKPRFPVQGIQENWRVRSPLGRGA